MGMTRTNMMVTSANGKTYEYDTLGNMIKSGEKEFKYDTFNRLKLIRNPYETGWNLENQARRKQDKKMWYLKDEFYDH